MSQTISKAKQMFLKLRFSSMFGLSKRITMYEKIGAFLAEKNNLNDSLIKIRNRYALRKDFRAAILSEWILAMEKGAKFSVAIAEWVPSSEMMLIEAGERGGALPVGLEQAAKLSTAAAKNKSAIVAGVALPFFLSVLLIVMLMLFQWKMAPIFRDLLPVAKWPDSAKSLNALSGFFFNNVWLLIIVAVGLSILVAKTMGTWVRSPRQIFDKIPPWSIYRGYQASSFLIALSALMKAGIPAFEALRVIEKNSSPWMRVHLGKMMVSMNLGGGNMGRALDTGLLDDEMAGDVQDYSDLGSFTETIYTLGERSVEKGIELINSRMAVVKAMLLIGVTVSIIWIYAASYGLQIAISEAQGKTSS